MKKYLFYFYNFYRQLNSEMLGIMGVMLQMKQKSGSLKVQSQNVYKETAKKGFQKISIYHLKAILLLTQQIYFRYSLRKQIDWAIKTVALWRM